MLKSFLLSAAVAAVPAFATAQVSCYNPSFTTAVGIGDDTVLPGVTLPFSFPFNGTTFTTVHASTNGFIYLSNGTTTGGANCCTGTTATLVSSPSPMICAYWSDLNVLAANSANVFVDTTPTTCTVTWNHVVEFGQTAQFDLQIQIDIAGQIGISISNTVSNISHTFLTGMSPGGGAATPAASNFAGAPLLVGNTCFEIFSNLVPCDLGGQSLMFTPTTPTQYAVTMLPCTATNQSYGAGCIRQDASFYENFPAVANFDLSPGSLSFLPSGTGYTVLPAIATYVAPSVNATVLGLTDDSSVAVTLTGSLPFPGGVTSSLEVCSNGHVAVGAGNSTGFTPAVATLLSNPATAFYSWGDFNPAAVGSGSIKFEEVGSVAYVTWDNVFWFGRTTGGNTMQFQFDEATGIVAIVWVNMDPQGSTTNTGASLIGYSPGGASNDPGSIDISATPTITVVGADVSPVALSASPVPSLGATVTFTTSNIPLATVLSAHILSFGQFNPGIDLTFLGAPGCFQLINTVGSSSALILGAPSASRSLTIPNNPAFAGQNLYSQSATLTPGINLLGVLTSNAVRSFIQ